MSKQWEIKFTENTELTLYINVDNNTLYSYDYIYDVDEDEEENAENCVEEFFEYNDKLTLSDEEEESLKEYLKDEFGKHDFSDDDDDDDDWSWKRTNRRVDNEFIEALENNTCYFSQYAIDVCMEKVGKGQTLLIPGEDRVPKNINVVTEDGDKYYARINSIEVLSQNTPESFAEAFGEYLTGLVVIAFQTRNKQKVLCFELEFVNESTDDRNIKFYKFDSNNKVDFDSTVDGFVYSMNDSSIYIYSDSELANELTPPLNYFTKKLEEINQRAETTRIPIDLQLLRENFSKFDNLIVDKDLLVIPIKGNASRLNSISVLVENYNGETMKYDFYEGHLSPISKEDRENYYESLFELEIELPKGIDLAVLDFVELSDKDVYLFHKLLTDADNYTCTIINNIEGDKARLRRIIAGIENAMNGKVVNENLVKTICKNSINVSCDPNWTYVPNEDYIEKIKREYPILESNVEQLTAIDKIMQMDSRGIDIMLIQGPPGTGKTELILSLAKELSKANKNTLITSNVHVACDNIVDRLKNNKDLVLKRYTYIKGEQYAKEIIENKRKYIENQVLEGFRYKDYIINSEKSYVDLKNETEELVERKKTIISSKVKYDDEIREYNDLLNESKKLEKEQSDLKSLIEQESILLVDTKKQHDDAVADLTSNELEISNQKEEYSKRVLRTTADEKKYAEKTDELNALYSQVAQKENTVSNIVQEIPSIKGKIEFTNVEIHQLEDLKQYLKEFNADLFKKEVLTFVVDGKPLSNKYYKMIVDNSLKKAQEIVEIYKKLRNDTEFWSGTKISLSTVEYLYFKHKKNALSFGFIDYEIISRVDDLYNYLRSSKIKRTLMSIFPFVKMNGKNQAYYAMLQDEINKELKKIQFYRDDYIYDCISNEIADERIDKLLLETNDKIRIELEKLSVLKEQLEQKELSAEDLNEEIDNLRKVIPVKTKSLLKQKSVVEKDKEEQTVILQEIKESENKSKKLNEEISNLLQECERIRQEIAKEREDLENNKKEIEQNKNKVFVLYNEKKDLIENYDSFVKKLDIDIKNIDKEITERTIVLTRIDKKVDEMVKCGFTIAEALDLVFSYVDELSKIQGCKDENINHYINGQGNEFNQMFLLSEKSDGSLISMTTNQIAALLNNAENRDLVFDYVIIDEASKCSFEDIIISLPRIKHLVLIGDFMQLDPMYDQYSKIDLIYQNMFTSNQWEALNRSSFSLLLTQFVEYNELNNIDNFDNNPFVAVMKRQYRMNQDIYHLIEPIYAIHKGFELIDEKQLTANDLKCVMVEGHEIQPPQGTSYYNMEEGNAIISFLKEFQLKRKEYPKIKTIGIITGYKAQENYLRRKLKSISIPGVQIGTFDRFQGREYDLVIVSLVRTDRLGFTSNVRRMNVAFSRAKNHLLIFGDFEALNKIAMKGTKIDDELANNDVNENTFVAKVLIPTLYKLSKKDGIKGNFISDNERIVALTDFLKDNAYGKQGN